MDLFVLSYSEFVELPGCTDDYFSRKLGGFQPLFLQIFSSAFSLSFPSSIPITHV